MRVYTGHDNSMMWILEGSLYVKKCMLEDGHAVNRAEYNLTAALHKWKQLKLFVTATGKNQVNPNDSGHVA